MIAAWLVVFREVLESALIISIVMVAARGLEGRNRWVVRGVASGVAGAVLVAVFASVIAATAEGMGMELFNAVILGLAVLMLGWHNVWMASHGREMAKHASDIGHAVHDGARPLYALAIVTGVAVLREGSETVLFLYGILMSGQESVWNIAIGAALGVATGAAIGLALYKGMVRIPLKQVFRVSSWMILLLACGLAAQCAGLLVQADKIPAMGDAIWDASHILAESSVLGKILHTLVGYIARPDGVQVLVYGLTFVIIGGLMRIVPMIGKKQVAIAVSALFVAMGLLPNAAHAEFKVRSPIVEQGELEIEHNGSRTFDSDKSRDNARSDTIEIGYGFTPYWKVELEGEFEGDPQKDLRYTATTLENYFQLTPQGKYWLDAGLFVEYSRASRRSDGDSVQFGPMLQKQTGGFGKYGMLHTVNLFVEQGVGNHGEHLTGANYAWQSRVQLDPLFEPGFEFYGEVADLDHSGSAASQEHRVGPMFAGKYSLSKNGLGIGAIKYEAGYLLPLTRATEDGALRWRMEYEIPF